MRPRQIYGLLSLVIVLFTASSNLVRAEFVGPDTIDTPVYLGGYGGDGGQRDLDLSPAIAYHPDRRDYLIVWLSARHASSGSSGFTVYGRFFNQKLLPVSDEFSISDQNSAARSAKPTVAAGPGGYAVVWTQKGRECRLAVQFVYSTLDLSDQQLDLGAGTHLHSPDVVYDPDAQRYAVAYVAGDDYLPAKFLNNAVADCGDNPLSTSQVKVAGFNFDVGNGPVIDHILTASETRFGAFRPDLTYSSEQQQYVTVWEDRRGFGGEPYAFHVYAQRIRSDLTAVGFNLPVAEDQLYVNIDDSANWTPNPVVAASPDQMLIAWFERNLSGNTPMWQVQGRFLDQDGQLGNGLSLASMTFGDVAEGRAPSGTLSLLYHSVGEYLLGINSHLDSLWGYYSSARIQRIDADGNLLDRNGCVQPELGVGNALDYDADSQLSLVLAETFLGDVEVGYAAVYGKHPPDTHEQDFDVWGNVGTYVDVVAAAYPHRLLLPLVMNRGGRSGSATSVLDECPPIDESNPSTVIDGN